ncbi:Protein of unknown function [Gryllus bimaculatus]|nr:Protein of unknown function [Gryllus bimaculatus]
MDKTGRRRQAGSPGGGGKRGRRWEPSQRSRPSTGLRQRIRPSARTQRRQQQQQRRKLEQQQQRAERRVISNYLIALIFLQCLNTKVIVIL